MATTQNARKTKADATHADFLRAGEVVFARFGYVKTEVAAVIVEADRARGTFYLYFKNKADLLRALVDAFQSELAAAGLRRDTAYDSTPEALLDLIWNVYRRHAGTFRALVQAAAVEDEFALLYADLRGYVRRDVRALVASARAGASRENDMFVVTCLETMIVNCMYDWLAADPDHAIPTEDEARALAALLHIFESAVAI